MDYSKIKSKAELEQLCEQGLLKRIELSTGELGAGGSPHGAVYLPEESVEVWEQFATTLDRYARKDLVNQVEIEPEFYQDSLVPTNIHVKAWHSEKKGVYEPSFAVWGEPDEPQPDELPPR